LNDAANNQQLGFLEKQIQSITKEDPKERLKLKEKIKKEEMKARGIEAKSGNASPGLRPSVSMVLDKKKLEEQVYLESKLKY